MPLILLRSSSRLSGRGSAQFLRLGRRCCQAAIGNAQANKDRSGGRDRDKRPCLGRGLYQHCQSGKGACSQNKVFRVRYSYRKTERDIKTTLFMDCICLKQDVRKDRRRHQSLLFYTFQIQRVSFSSDVMVVLVVGCSLSTIISPSAVVLNPLSSAVILLPLSVGTVVTV